MLLSLVAGEDFGDEFGGRTEKVKVVERFVGEKLSEPSGAVGHYTALGERIHCGRNFHAPPDLQRGLEAGHNLYASAICTKLCQ